MLLTSAYNVVLIFFFSRSKLLGTPSLFQRSRKEFLDGVKGRKACSHELLVIAASHPPLLSECVGGWKRCRRAQLSVLRRSDKEPEGGM